MANLGSARGLRDSLLHVLGDRTLYRVAQPVPASTLLRAVSLLTSLPDQHPACKAWDEYLERAECNLHGIPYGSTQEFDRWVQEAQAEVNRLQATREFDRWVQEAQAEVNIPQAENEVFTMFLDGLTVPNGDGWSLTQAGVQKAAALRPWFSLTTITVEWVRKFMDAKAIRQIEQYLQVRCLRSVAWGEIPELVSNYLVKFMARDSVSKRLLNGGSYPTIPMLKGWTYNAALSQFRDEGRDALTRSFKGARTEKDLRDGRKAAEELACQLPPTENQVITYSMDDEGQSDFFVSDHSSGAMVDVVAGDLEEEVLMGITKQRGMVLLEEALRRQKPANQERLIRVLSHLQLNKSRKDIAELEGVSLNRASALISNYRDTAESMMAQAEVAARVLGYIQDEPFATDSDISEDIGENGVSLVPALVAAGRLREIDGSYTLTRAGQAALGSGHRLGVLVPLLG